MKLIKVLSVLAVAGSLVTAPVWAGDGQKPCEGDKPCGEAKKECPQSGSKCCDKAKDKAKDSKGAETPAKKAKETK